MTLINCPECGSKISSKAASCPACAFTIRKNSTQVQNSGAMLLFGSFIIGLALAIGLSRLAPEDNQGLRVALGLGGLTSPIAIALFLSIKHD